MEKAEGQIFLARQARRIARERDSENQDNPTNTVKAKEKTTPNKWVS